MPNWIQILSFKNSRTFLASKAGIMNIKLSAIFLCFKFLSVTSVRIVQVVISKYSLKKTEIAFKVSIPRTVEVGEENIILNCDYHFDEEEAAQLEIKWYFNKDPAPFFQWIAGLPDSKEPILSFLYF